ncbi:hypothetical protein ACFE04_030249 [Oxalis oulophora]
MPTTLLSNSPRLGTTTLPHLTCLCIFQLFSNNIILSIIHYLNAPKLICRFTQRADQWKFIYREVVALALTIVARLGSFQKSSSAPVTRPTCNRSQRCKARM